MKQPISIMLLSVLLCACLAAQSQSTGSSPKAYYEFTPGTDLGGLSLPYDSAFTLKVHLKQKENLRDGVILIAGRIHKNLGDIMSRKNEKMMKVTWDSTSATFNLRFDYYYNKDFTDRLNKEITNVNKGTTDPQKKLAPKNPAGPLKPSRKYYIVLMHDVLPGIFDPAADGSDEKSVFTAFYKLATAEEANVPQADQDDLRAKAFALYKKVYDDTRIEKISTLDPDSTVSYKIFKDRIYPSYKDNSRKQDSLAKLIKNADDAIALYKDVPKFKASAGQVLHRLQHSCCLDKKEKCCDALPDFLDSSIEVLQTAADIDDSDWHLLNKGKYFFQNRVGGKLAAAQFGNKNSPAQNIAASLVQLEMLDNLLLYLKNKYSSFTCPAATDTCPLAAITQLEQWVAGEIAGLSAIRSALDGVDKQNAAFKDLVIRSSSKNFRGLDIINESSFIMDFQTRSSVYITPIFGYAVYGFQKNFTDFSPYLGFQVNFEPMNRNVPFRLIREKTLLQRLCFTTAWTLRSVSYAGKRADFFGNSTSLVTALGFKFSHVVMLNMGALWFKKLDPDPLITKKTIVCTPMLSLSINFNVSQLLNGFTSLIPSL